jgi:hypothetical protein
MLRRVALVRTDVSEKLSASIIKMTKIGELETTLAITSNWRMLRRFLQEPQGITSQETAFFIVTAAKTSNPATLSFLLFHWLRNTNGGSIATNVFCSVFRH